MKTRLLMIVFFVCAVAMPVISPAIAQGFNRYFETLSELNRNNPAQNPLYDNAEDILGRRILDRKNKVIGEVEDVVLRNNGRIAFLNVDFNRLRLGPEVYLNYREMRIEPVSNGYELAFSDDEIENFYPNLLAGIETAAGQDDIFSLKKIIDANVEAEDGRNIGTVSDVLFARNGTRAEALLVMMKTGEMRGDKIAIPFVRQDVREDGRRKKLVVNNELADAMAGFSQ